jgi:hypothetical protein
MSVLDTIKAATPLVRRVTLCLDGALQAEHDALQRDLVEAAFKDKTEDSLAASNTSRVVQQMERVRKRMSASEVAFSFTALAWFRRMELQAEHPPRDGSLIDRSEGYNVETYVPALIREACVSVQGADKKVITDIPRDHWDHLLGTPATDEAPAVPPALNFPQVDALFGAANAANENATTVPPSALSLLGNQDSGESLKSPGPGTSRRNASKGGSRSGTRKSTVTRKAASSA